MSNKHVPKGIPSPIQQIFQSTPVLGNEDARAYWRLMSQAIDDFEPKDLYEWILIKDFVDDAWEAARWRKLKVPLLELERRRAMDAALRRILPGHQGKEIAEISEHYTSDLMLRAAAENALKPHGQTLDCVDAQAFKQCTDHMERMDSLMESATRRRDRAIKTLEQRRFDIILPDDAMPVIDQDPIKKVADETREEDDADVESQS